MIDIWEIIKHAHATIDHPYVWGEKGPKEFDCSGVTYFACAQAGIKGFPAGTADTQFWWCANSQNPAYLHDPLTNKIVPIIGDSKIMQVSDSIRRIPGLLIFDAESKRDEDTGDRFWTMTHTGIIVDSNGYTIEGYNPDIGIKKWKRAFRKKAFTHAAFIPGVVYTARPGSIKNIEKPATPVSVIPPKSSVNPISKAIPRAPILAAEMPTMSRLEQADSLQTRINVQSFLGDDKTVESAFVQIATKALSSFKSSQPVDLRSDAFSAEAISQAVELGIQIDMLRQGDSSDKLGKSNATMTQTEFLLAMGMLTSGGN